MTVADHISLSAATKILLLGAGRVGDMLFATPAIKMLRDIKPEAQIDVIVFSPFSQEVMAYNPAIDNIYVSPNRWRIKRLAADYDIAVAVHESREIQHTARYLHNTQLYNRDAMGVPMHMKMFPVNFLRHLLKCPNLPYPESYLLFPQPKHFSRMRNLLVDLGAKSGHDALICCHMGCKRVAQRGSRWFKGKNIAGDTKCWEFGNYARLAQRLAEQRPDIKLVLTGTRGEQRIAKEYLSGLPNIIDIIGQTSVLDLAALMTLCQMFLSANTGPLHIACATEIPLVTLIGKHDPAVYGPSPPAPHRVVLRKSNSVDDISVDDVYTAILANLPSSSHLAADPVKTAVASDKTQL